MSTVTFDTLDFTRKLREAGLDEKQAEAVVRVVSAAQDGLVTREHFDARLDSSLAPIRADINLLKWMMGVLVALAIANFAKQFF